MDVEVLVFCVRLEPNTCFPILSTVRSCLLHYHKHAAKSVVQRSQKLFQVVKHHDVHLPKHIFKNNDFNFHTFALDISCNLRRECISLLYVLNWFKQLGQMNALHLNILNGVLST